MKRNPLPPTRHLRGAIRRIDKVVRKLCDELLAAYIAYVEAVCWDNKREAHKLFFCKVDGIRRPSSRLGRKTHSEREAPCDSPDGV